MSAPVQIDSALLQLLVDAIDRIKEIGQQTPETQQLWVEVINKAQARARTILLEHESVQQFTTGGQTEPVETHKTFI